MSAAETEHTPPTAARREYAEAIVREVLCDPSLDDADEFGMSTAIISALAGLLRPDTPSAASGEIVAECVGIAANSLGNHEGERWLSTRHSIPHTATWVAQQCVFALRDAGRLAASAPKGE